MITLCGSFWRFARRPNCVSVRAAALALFLQLAAPPAHANEALPPRASGKAEEDGASRGPELNEDLKLPEVPVQEMAASSPQPSWDTGLLLGACGLGNERAWEITKFCIGGLVDVLFLRKREDQTGLGGYLELGSAGFRDFRVSGGMTSVVSLIDWFSLSLRAGGLAVLSSKGAQPGVEGYFGFGHRSVSLSSHYALSHSFFAGMQYALPSNDLPASHALWLGLQIDGVWLTAPVGLFR